MLDNVCAAQVGKNDVLNANFNRNVLESSASWKFNGFNIARNDCAEIEKPIINKFQFQFQVYFSP